MESIANSVSSDQSSNSNDESSTRDSLASDPSQNRQGKADLKETRILTISKIVVFFVILAGAAALSTVTYLFVESTEEKEFNDAVRLLILRLRPNALTYLSDTQP